MTGADDGVSANRTAAAAGASDRAREATEAALRRLGSEHRLLTALEVAQLESQPVVTSDWRHGAGDLLSVRRDGMWLFPDFQFGPDRRVLPAVAELRRIAGDFGWSEQSLILWMITPCGRLGGDEPVEHLADAAAVTQAARASFDISS